MTLGEPPTAKAEGSWSPALRLVDEPRSGVTGAICRGTVGDFGDDASGRFSIVWPQRRQALGDAAPAATDQHQAPLGLRHACATSIATDDGRSRTGHTESSEREEKDDEEAKKSKGGVAFGGTREFALTLDLERVSPMASIQTYSAMILPFWSSFRYLSSCIASCQPRRKKKLLFPTAHEGSR